MGRSATVAVRPGTGIRLLQRTGAEAVGMATVLSKAMHGVLWSTNWAKVCKERVQALGYLPMLERGAQGQWAADACHAVTWPIQRLTVRSLCGNTRHTPYLFFNLPLGSTEVSGAIGRMDSGEVLTSGGKLVSFFGFLTILLLSCMPLAIEISSIKPPM